MRTFCPKEYKVVALRECPLPDAMPICDTPDRAAEYWRAHVVNHPAFNPDVECFVALLLNTRRRIKGHVLISTGTLDTLLVHAREVFRPAIVAAASAVVIMRSPFRRSRRDRASGCNRPECQLTDDPCDDAPACRREPGNGSWCRA